MRGEQAGREGGAAAALQIEFWQWTSLAAPFCDLFVFSCQTSLCRTCLRPSLTPLPTPPFPTHPAGELSPPEFHHYGLAAPLYTHFTSPIRRYADVLTHRVLMAALGLRPLPDSLRDRLLMHGVVGNLNARHRNAQHAGRASVELHTLIFFKGKEVVADARITRIRGNGLIVFVPKYGIEGPVYLEDTAGAAGKAGGAEDGAAPTPAFVYDEERQTVVSASRGVRWTIFDACAVRIAVEEGAGRRRTLKLRLVPRGELPEGEAVQG